VLFHNTAILGSPFICKVCDISQIIVTNLHGIAVAGKPFEFDSKYTVFPVNYCLDAFSQVLACK
jgi:hypothetical protein